MFRLGLIELVLLLVPLLVAGVAVVLVGRSRSRLTSPAPAREARLVGLTRVVGVVVGLVTVSVIAGGTHGTGSMLGPTVFGACVLLAVVAGETLVRPRLEPGVRSATLGVRRVRDYAPRIWIPVAAVGVMTFSLLLLTTITASPDPTDGTSRMLH